MRGRRDMEFPLYDLVSKGAQVNLRPVKIPWTGQRRQCGRQGALLRRWYQEGLLLPPTQRRTCGRAILSQEARARAALLVICTHDYLSHSQ